MGTKALIWTGLALLAIVVGLVAYTLITDEGPPIIRRTVQSVQDYAFPQTDRPTLERGVERTPEAPRPTPVASPPAKVDQPVATVARPPAARTAAPPAPAPLVTRGAPPPARPVPVARRTDFFVPGSVSSWTSVDVGSAPLRLRAGGVVSTPEDSSGPQGIGGSVFERNLARQRTATSSVRVMPAAPYLALVGRVCDGEVCSDPFVVGSTRLLCSSNMAEGARLQLWTNNYIQVDGVRTLNRFSSATGGFAVYAESEPASACGPAGVTAAAAPDVATLAAGQILRKPEFVVSSSQTTWKPFFLPLTMPLRVRASGEMWPRGGARATGPAGISVPDQARWVYPGTSDLVVDGENRLYDARFNYQALIGRICGSSGCGQPFLVGDERVVCASDGYADRLELWINHIMRPEGLLSTQLAVSMEAFEMQGRRGDYRFEIARAQPGACATEAGGSERRLRPGTAGIGRG